MKQVQVYIDGASRGNPGPSAVGIFAKDESGNEIIKKGEYIGATTNNVAEYMALIRVLKYLSDSKVFKKRPTEIVIHTDSELMKNQISGDYRIKSKNLIPLAIEARGLIKKFTGIEFKLIDRKDNKVADKLANKAMNLQEDVDELSAE